MGDGRWEAFLGSVGLVFVFVGSAAAAGLLCDLREVTPYTLPSISELDACQEDAETKWDPGSSLPKLKDMEIGTWGFSSH